MARKARVSAAMVALMAQGERHAWTLEELHIALGRQGHATDFSSVFRAAEKLAADGVTRKILLDDGRTRFEPVAVHHDHRYCTRVHELTPDEHTWPITFSYAIGGYSTARGMRAGLLFSLALAIQAALASELAYLGLTQWFTFESFDSVVYVAVGIIMAAAGLFAMG